jgi:hypothetical protein
MPRFVAVHTMPMTEAEFTEKLGQPMPQMPPGLVWKQTYCDFADGKFFCEWEAPNKEAVEQAFKMMEMPYDVVYPVRLFDVAKREIEP